MCKHMWVWCRYTRGRFGRTHGEEGEGSSSVPLTKICPRGGFRGSPKKSLRVFTFSSLRRSREQHVPDSSNHSLLLNALFNSRHMTQRHTQTRTHNTTTYSNTQHSTATAQHSTAQHSTAHATQKQRKREEEMKETTRDRDEQRYK